ncbi:MAG: helix-turn-helix domain-containing protein [Oscillospiraceae bacterium]|nr:helix-turn-helix domain-containing protein [Candidatus Ruminococcus equi]
MDQVKIGKFIAEERKKKSLTQRELADKLSISDKTVSKWETGKGLPEVSLMMPLCEILSVSVNELLSGERIHDSEYKEKAEMILVDLMKEKEESKKNILLSIISAFIGVLGGCTIIALVGNFEMQTWLRVLLVVIAIIVMAGGIFIAAALDMKSGTYECRKCGKRFVPSAGAYIAGPHSLTTRYLKCPHCGEKSFCKRRLTH